MKSMPTPSCGSSKSRRSKAPCVNWDWTTISLTRIERTGAKDAFPFPRTADVRFCASAFESSLQTKSADVFSEKRHCDEHGHACDDPPGGTVTRSSWNTERLGVHLRFRERRRGRHTLGAF